MKSCDPEDIFSDCYLENLQNGTFARGGAPGSKWGETLKVTFRKSGPILRSIKGERGYSCKIKTDGANCLGKGGGGGGLSVGSEEGREFLQPETRFGSGGAQGQPGKHGVVVIWSEKGNITGIVCSYTFMHIFSGKAQGLYDLR